MPTPMSGSRVLANGRYRQPCRLARWAAGKRVILAIVFTDIVGSTALGNKVGDEEMDGIRRAHFTKGSETIRQHGGRVIKTIGDSFMAAFKCVEDALDCACAIQSSPGHAALKIRAGIHVGPIRIEGDDVFGAAVNFAARVASATKRAEIWVSDRAKEDIDAAKLSHQGVFLWVRHRCTARGFKGRFVFWSLKRRR